MKKTSVYARKKLRQPQATQPHQAWQIAIARCSSYDEAHSKKASELILVLRGALQRLKEGSTAGDNTSDHDEVMHALATARIRAEHIAGKKNAAEPSLVAGIKALNRAAQHWESQNVWSIPAHDFVALDAAVETYVTILRASSPMQMENAWYEHLQRLGELLAHTEA